MCVCVCVCVCVCEVSLVYEFVKVIEVALIYEFYELFFFPFLIKLNLFYSLFLSYS